MSNAFIIFNSISSIGQNINLQGFIIDSKTKIGIPYTNIMILDASIGTTSNISGEFNLSLEDSTSLKTLVVSNIGYITKMTTIQKSGNITIELMQNTYQLTEIIVKPSKEKVSPVIIDKIKLNKCVIRYSNDTTNGLINTFFPFRPEEPLIEASYFPFTENTEGYYKLNTIQVYVKNFLDSQSVFRLRLFKASDAKAPSEDLINIPLLVPVSKKKELVTINLDSLNITMSKEGIFVGIEVLAIPANIFKIPTQKGDSLKLYSPYLFFYPTRESNYSFWIYSKGKWQKKCQQVPDYLKKPQELYYKPAISISLTK